MALDCKVRLVYLEFLAMTTYTMSVEDYLKAIFELSRATGSAVTTEVASRLAVASASVSAMVRRLTGQGLVSHERYGALKLTKKGRSVALQLVRRHRVFVDSGVDIAVLSRILAVLDRP